MVNNLVSIGSIIASLTTVVVVVVGLGRWGGKLERSIEDLKEQMKEVRKTTHTHRRFGLISAAMATLLLLFKG